MTVDRPQAARRRAPAIGLSVLTAAISLAGCDRATPATPAAPATAAGDATGKSVGIGAIDTSVAAAERYLSAGDTASAESIIVTLLDRAPQDARAHELYGRVLYLRSFEASGRGDHEAAARLVDESCEQYRLCVEKAQAAGADPLTLAGLRQSAGEIASAAGRRDEALDDFRAAGRLDPNNAKAPLYEAQILIQLDRVDEARAALGRVLALDPEEAYAHASLAALALRAGDGDGAIDHITEARRNDPGNLSLRLQEARIRRELGDPRRALELLLALDDRTRVQEAVTAEVAACYGALDEPAKAAGAWEDLYRARMNRPEAWRAAVRAARARLDAGDRDRASFLYERARLQAPNEPEVQALGEVIGSSPRE